MGSMAMLMGWYACFSSWGALADPAPVFVLHKTDAGLTIRKDMLMPGEKRSYPTKPGDGFVAVILPVGPGGSGSLIRQSDHITQDVHCTNEGLQVVSHQERGKEWKGPIRSLEDLRDDDIRVCVTAFDGSKSAFIISGYERATIDTVGPVIDMFAGRIPMKSGDYSIYTDTYHSRVHQAIHGSTPVDYDRYLFANGVLADGTSGTFVIDLGAGQTVVTKRFLPKGIDVARLHTVQYSSAGKEMLKYEPSGATGKVQSILGGAVLPLLRFGEIAFTDADVVVMPELPELAGRKIVGILGIDLLQQTDRIVLEFPKKKDGVVQLRMSKAAKTPGAAEGFSIPFVRMSSHLVLKCNVNDTPVHFYLDTGAPTCFLDGQTAEAAKVHTKKNQGQDVKGFDAGSKHRADKATIERMTVGTKVFEDVDAMVSSLPVFDLARKNGAHIGLLGNSLLNRFARVEINFHDRVVRFVP